MISKNLKYYYNFDDVVKNDPTKNSIDQYWGLRSQHTPRFCLNDTMFSSEELERIIVLGKRFSPKRATTTGKGEDCLEQRRSFTSWLNINEETNWIYRRITDNVISANEAYWRYDLEKIEKIQFTSYFGEENGVYHAHIDPLSWANTSNRKLSLVLQLSDPSEYEGGELRLHTSNAPDVIKKKKGLTVFFPSHTLHEVTPITKGTRYSLVVWVHGPNLR